MGKKRDYSAATMDMTPMIDCVFQLIIFFVVTITVDQKLNEDIKLEFSKHGPVQKEPDPRLTVIEVDKRGWISMRGTPLSKAQLRDLLQAKYRRLGGAFPILIRGDYRTKHQDIRAVMDICTANNIWKIEFAAIKEKKGQG
jgi:biopolymer transport protein ExbD